MQKRYLFLLIFLCSAVQSLQAQKFGYIDAEFIYSKMPEYKQAQQAIEEWTNDKVSEVSEMYAQVEQLEKIFRAEEPLLTEEMKHARLEAIEGKNKELRELNNKVFGFDGMLFQKRKDLMKPVIDRIYKAVEKVARQKQLMFLFLKDSENPLLIYTDPRHDYTDYVMEEMGINPTDTAEDTPAQTEETPTKEQPKPTNKSTKANKPQKPN